MAASGCASSNRYSPSDLPARLQATPTTNIQTVGLTKLATDAIPSDQIGRGDVLELNIAGGFSADDGAKLTTRVNDEGYVEVPHIKPLHVEGLTLEGAETAVKTALVREEIFRDPHVTVTMKQQKTIQVTVVGAVQKEGTYHLPTGSSGLLQAIAQAGSFTEKAGTSVEIRYPGEPAEFKQQEMDKLMAQTDGGVTQAGASSNGEIGHSPVGRGVPVRTAIGRTVKVDLASLAEHEPSSLKLVDGAVVMVERRDPPPLQVGGLVKKPDVYEYPVGKNVRLLDAVSMAGGESSLAADKVYIIRRRANMSEPVLIQASIKDAKRNGADNLLLEPGDTVTIEQTPATVMLEALRTIGFNIGARAF